MAACGTRWHVAHLLFSVINEGGEAGAPATQAWITSNNKTLELIRKEKSQKEKPVRVGDGRMGTCRCTNRENKFI